MAWLRVNLTDEEQRMVNEERDSHSDPHVRRKMLVLWTLHCGLKRRQAANVAAVGLATVQRYVAAYRDGGLEGLRQWNVQGPVSDLAAWRDAIRESFEQRPVSTMSEACARIEQLTGRQRFNVLGAWNALTRELIAVTNTTVVNTETMCELLRNIAALGLKGQVTLVLDNAPYQRNAVVAALAAQLGRELLFLPSYSPNLNLIERLWRFLKRRSIYRRYHPTFADFKAAIQETIAGIPTTHAKQLAPS